MINTNLKVFGPLATVTVHIDGPRCNEKARAYKDRDAKRTTTGAKLDTLIANIEIKPTEGKWESWSHMIPIKKNLRQLFTFSHNEKRGLAAPFDRYNNFLICHCGNEADVCFAVKCTPTSIAVSGGSGLFTYCSIQRVLRLISHRHHIYVHEKQDVLETLGFSSDIPLLVYDIVSDHDYIPNISTVGLATNMKALSVVIDTDAEKLAALFKPKLCNNQPLKEGGGLTTAKDRRLKRAHPTTALTLGTLKTCIVAKLNSNSDPNLNPDHGAGDGDGGGDGDYDGDKDDGISLGVNEVRYDTHAPCPPLETPLLLDPGERRSVIIVKLDPKKTPSNEHEILRILERIYKSSKRFRIKAILKLAGGSNGRRRGTNTNVYPRPHCEYFDQKYALQFRQYLNRGAVGTENIARVCESQIIQQK
ncbi:hypothetical protein BX616_005493 [Lobosporangium transversale]|nr:hypothetical protein BX616_005493 [Lobosporangium transversale]